MEYEISFQGDSTPYFFIMSASSLTLLAPAKINLSLQLLNKRADGYHEIETLMAPITLADELEITCTHTAAPIPITLTCNDPSLPLGEKNLCVQAAHAFQKATGIQEPVSITLLKKIPYGAGLGGGSSDAAAVLQGMNALFKKPLVEEELHLLSVSLGSDVPFFLQRKPAWCRGRGEILSEAAPLPAWNLLLIKPPFSVDTTWAYQHWDKKKWTPKEPMTHDEITLFNHLELPVFEKYLLLPVLKEWLLKLPEVITVWMSGSGSTMVALLNQELSWEQNQRLQTTIRTTFGEYFWIKSVTFLT
ncbi:MAG: 4-(cytidine 5'-diphospho)-2-C-methyl-D-erythritol kinase [Verrucomicrobia bacterium]|jgi:4-diphosphocytidyl-2-C-methyl-D-erythritol kinase|nr:MAG: 4-(cytidine 5'-diphospho)-2-C-methyl-D-erythritol kinase [Verrucomicrobiota bacterium]